MPGSLLPTPGPEQHGAPRRATGTGREERGRPAGLPRIRRFFRERPRPIAAMLTGFSHNTGNLARSRENPFPSPRAVPAPPLRPPRRRPRPSAPWLARGRGATRRRADPGVGCDRRAETGPGVGAQAWWEAQFPRGIPIDVARESARARGGGRDAGGRASRWPAPLRSPRGSKARFLTHRLKLLLFLIQREGGVKVFFLPIMCYMGVCGCVDGCVQCVCVW